ncbi:hypothetical protein C1T31_12405 [Hanstruepera neustonica]|uniref:Secretion system C-terminal sorting domain-containing protein n=1 Tax=Hanstruepera neustonica TaxID=1445657 RepID=A0A2K1DWG8_9FLAO|nr:META domain-containing protein [Hanstruepera neustonica]PNQ72343.1 hypothetical protein C1T31_12405 [Hanstruepera neustonica]
MKTSLFFFIFLSLQVSAQDILGEWQLIYIEVDGVRQYSTIPNSINYINFEDETNVEGGVCNNGYGGQYSIISEDTFTIEFNALAGYCNYEVETDVFLHPYLWDVLGNVDASDFLNYEITGTGDNQTLQITNSLGNLAFYNREGLPENRLPDIWYLHEISVDNVITENTFNSQSYIEFTTNNGFLFGIEYQGNAICNDFFGHYNLSQPTTLIIEDFTTTLAICNDSEARDFESDYFDIFRNTDPLTITYDITGTGNDEVLVLTNPDGDYALYGRQERLSTSEFEMELNNLSLTNNPVQETLTFNNIGNIEANYAIYSINGKQLTKTKLLDSKYIDVSSLDVGLYFLRISSKSNNKTIKFIKS